MKITMTLTRIGFGGLMGESVNKRVQDRGGGGEDEGATLLLLW